MALSVTTNGESLMIDGSLGAAAAALGGVALAANAFRTSPSIRRSDSDRTEAAVPAASSPHAAPLASRAPKARNAAGRHFMGRVMRHRPGGMFRPWAGRASVPRDARVLVHLDHREVVDVVLVIDAELVDVHDEHAIAGLVAERRIARAELGVAADEIGVDRDALRVAGEYFRRGLRHGEDGEEGEEGGEFHAPDVGTFRGRRHGGDY